MKIKGLPDEINAAIQTLWDYADDACHSGRTKEECDEEGYHCSTESGHFLTFVLPRKEVDVPMYRCDACGGIYERQSDEEVILSYCKTTGKDAKLIKCVSALDVIMKGVTPDNTHPEQFTDEPKGKEIL